MSFLAFKYYSITSMRYSTLRQQRIMIASVISGLGFVLIVSMVAFITFESDRKTARNILGLLTCFTLFAVNMSHLITSSTILKTKDSSFIHKPLVCGILLNACVWTTYGLLLNDPVCDCVLLIVIPFILFDL